MTATIEKPRVEQTRHEGWAVGWLTLGMVTAFIGAFIGTYLVLRSTVWSWKWKAAVLALPVVIVVAGRAFPRDVPLTVGLLALLVMIVGAAGAAYVLLGAAERGGDQPQLGRVGAAVVAAAAVAIASGLLTQVHAIGSYDLRDDAIAIAQTADGAGEEFGIIQDDNTWLESDGPSAEQLGALTGPGNARFVQLFEDARSKVDADPWVPSKELGSCVVFPVVTSKVAGIDSVEGMAQFCDGPSKASGYVTLTDR